jgi:hypothetical protein
MPVGPELPPHLVKRKRSIDDDEHLSSPPHKVQAATAPRTLGPTLPPSKNPDELVVDDSSEDEYGPSAPAAKATRPTNPPSKRVLGPGPPPQSKNPEELDLEESSEDDYGPLKPTSKPSPPPKRIHGPAPPPAPLSERPHNPPDDSDSDSDDYGPSLPPAPGSAAEATLFAAQKLEREEAAATTASAKPQRAEWMLAPPTDSDWTSRVDPTKLKNRKFQSGKGAKAPTEKSGISAIWTETPEEKRKRLADEVLGRAEVATSSRGGGKQKREEGESKEDEATARRIREYNEKVRGKSLYEERRERKERDGTKEEEDDPSKRGFDREKDMALGGRMGHGEKREMLAKAKDFGSRFQKGSFL